MRVDQGAQGRDNHVGGLEDVLAVIESAKARDGKESLERFIRKRLPDAPDSEVAEAADVATEIIDSIPIFLARARQEAGERRLESVIGPLLDHAERYFLQPVDLIPEMTQGLAGLLDDCYLVIRILENLEKGPEPFLDWDLEHPAEFLRGLVGKRIANRLDMLAVEAMKDVSKHLSELWSRLSHPA